MAQSTKLVLDGVNGTLRVSPPLSANDKKGADPVDNIIQLGKETINPFKTAPPHDEIGGILHFGDVSREVFDAFMKITGVFPEWIRQFGREPHDYAVFYEESDTGRDGYLAQMRLVSKRALRFKYESITEEEFDSFQDQELSMTYALWGFMEDEKKKYGTNFGRSNLTGTFGGGEGYTKEALAFGFMIEDSHYGIYRIWSRIWSAPKHA